MSATAIVEVVLLALCLVASAFFSAAEIALFALSKLQVRRLRQESPTRGQLISELLSRPQRVLSAILFGNTGAAIAAAVIGYDILRRLTPTHADWLSVPIMTMLLLIFGEVSPKAIVIQHPEFFATRLAPLINLFERLTRHVRHGFETLSGAIVRSLERLPYFADRKVRGSEPTTDEYRTLLRMSESAGVVRREERDMVNKILALDKMQVREIMTPRTDMQCLEDTAAPAEMVETLRKFKHRRVPIIHDTPDSVEGILNVKEFLADPHRELDEVVELPNFIPDTMSVGKLLKSFRKQEHPVAIVIGEYGGTQGLVTLEDILEEIVGEIEDEFDTSEIMVQKLADNRWLINGKARLDFVNSQCGLRLTADGVETIAGWLIAQLGALPKGGEFVQAAGVRATARKVAKNRIWEVELERTS